MQSCIISNVKSNMLQIINQLKQINQHDVPSLFALFFKVFFLQNTSTYVIEAKSCCESTNSYQDLNKIQLDSIFYFDFVINELPENTFTNVITLKDQQSQIIVLMVRQNHQFTYQINYDKDKFTKINSVQLGVFQQIIIKFENDYLSVDWLSDFKVIYQERFLASHQNFQIINNVEFICQLQILKKDINQLLTDCEANQSIHIKLHPQIKQIHSQTFNNNYYKIQFWVKQLFYDDQNMVIEIQDANSLKLIRILILSQQFELEYDSLVLMKDSWQKAGWISFQLSYQISNSSFKYKRDDYYKHVNISQSYQYQVRLLIQAPNNIIFTEVLLQISRFSKGNLCVPGCSACNQQGYCQQCEFGYIQQGDFCECEEDFQYFLSPSECYIRLDYNIILPKNLRVECPTFGGQICPQCLDERITDFTFCLFTTDIKLDSDLLELDFNYYHLYISYKQIDDCHQVDDSDIIFKLAYPNIIYYKQVIKDIYILGQTISRNTICYNGLYFNNMCKKQKQNCVISFKDGRCKQCRQPYFKLNGNCKRCPQECEFCKIFNHKIICLKCVKKFFLNFQRKCIPCLLKYCEQCYHYNGNQNTLERNFETKDKSFVFNEGCSYCQDQSFLQIETRNCKLKQNQYIITVNNKNYEDIITLRTFLDKLYYFCHQQLPNCQFCQNGLCLYCSDNFVLYFEINKCIQQRKGLQIYNYNQNLKDYEMHFNFVTFLYFNYTYFNINKSQSFYLIDCQFNNFVGISQNIEQDSQILFLTNRLKQCPFFCSLCLNSRQCLVYNYQVQFKMNFTSQYVKNNIELEIFNNHIQNIDQIHLSDFYTNQLHIIITKLTFQFPQKFFNIPLHSPGNDVCIQFANISILNDTLYFNESISIINSQFNVMKKLKIDIRSNNKSKFLFQNVTFTGLNNESNFVWHVNNSFQFSMINVTIQNFSFITFFINTQTFIMEELNLLNLQITDRNQEINIFRFFSQYANIRGLKIYDCNFTNILLFQIQYNLLKIINIQIVKVLLQASNLIVFGQSYSETLILKTIYIKSIICYDSRFFVFTIYNFEGQISQSFKDIYITHSKFNNSYIFESALEYRFIQFTTFKNIIISQNLFIKSSFIYISSQSISLIDFHLTNNVFQTDLLFIKLVAPYINLIRFLYNSNHFSQGILIYFTSLFQLILQTVLFQNSTFVGYTMHQGFLSFHSDFNMSIKNLYFIDIITYSNILQASFVSAIIDNLQIIDMQILEQKEFHFKLFPSKDIDSNINIQNLLFLNIYKVDQEQSQDQQFPFLQFQMNVFQLLNVYALNIRIKQCDFIRILDSYQYIIEKFYGQNITIFNLISSSAHRNLMTQVQISQLYSNLHLITIEPKSPQKQFIHLTQINFEECRVYKSIINIKFIDFIGVQNIFLINIRSNKIKSFMFINIDCEKANVEVFNLQITKSDIDMFFFSKGTFNTYLFHFVQLKEINFLTKFLSFNMYGMSIILYDILLHRLVNFTLSSTSIQLTIEKFLLKNSMVEILEPKVRGQIRDHFSQTLIRGMHLINNTIFERAFVIFIFDSKVQNVIDFYIHNNTMVYNKDTFLIGFISSALALQISITNNKCGQNCMLIVRNSTITFTDIFDQQNLAHSTKINIQENCKIKNFTIQSFHQTHLALLINEKYIINDNQQQQLFPMPSGQKINEYKIYDYNNLKSLSQIQDIRVININNYKSSTIYGQFNINVYEYDLDTHQIVNDLIQYKNIAQFRQTQTHSGLNDLQVTFNPYQQNILMILIEKSDDIQQKLTIFAKTQLCQIGEVFTKQKCLICNPELQIYSVKQKSNFCSIVDQGSIEDHLQGSIKLRKGYWRPYVYSSVIEQCDLKSDQCIGGWHTGHALCKIGYIGAVCKACDIYNLRGSGFYLQEKKECQPCREFKSIYLMLRLIVIIFMQYILLFRLCLKLVLQQRSNAQNYQKLILQRLINYRHFHILSKYITDIPQLIFTILIGNLALLKLITQNSFQLPDIMTIFTNPVVLEQNSYSCIQRFTNLDYQYWIYYFRLIIPILTSNVFLMFMTLFGKNNIRSYFLFPLISLLLSQGPTLSILFIKQTLYNTYSNIKYSNTDFSIRYYSHVHQENLYLFIVPIIVILNVVLPLMLMILINIQIQRIFKDKYMQIGNFILPFKSNYQELFNYFQNSFVLLLLSLNEKQLSQSKITLLITLIMIISWKQKIYKIMLISRFAQQSEEYLVYILYIALFFRTVDFQYPILVILATLFIIKSVKEYLQAVLKQNKLQIIQAIINNKTTIKYLGFKNYIQSLHYWKLIKQNRNQVIKNQRGIQDQSIILQTVQTKMTSNSLVEIEMISF